MMQVLSKLLSIALVMAICSSACADIVWMRTQGDVDVSISYSGGKYYATITSSVNGGSVEFWSTSNGSDTIGYIRNNASGSSTVGVKVRANPSNGYLVHSVEEISEQTSSTIVLYECTVAHDIGDVDVWAIGTLDAGGGIYGQIQSNATNITLVLASGDIVGPISAPYGRILGIRADGSIGTSGSPVSFTAIRSGLTAWSHRPSMPTSRSLVRQAVTGDSGGWRQRQGILQGRWTA